MQERPRWSVLGAGLAVLLGALGFVVIAEVSAGPELPGSGVFAALAVLFYKWTGVLWASGLYVLSAWGLGGLVVSRWFSGMRSGAVRLGVGVTVLLTLSHAAGMAGALSAGSGRWGAWLALVPGLVAVVRDGVGVVRGGRWAEVVRAAVRPRLGDCVFVWLGFVLAGASVPAGVLWRSEYGGYDALSYHLPLPQEWYAGGRLWPVEHNVYSYLPGYMEAAYLHLGAMLGGGEAGSWSRGLLSHEGGGVLACQMLHGVLGFLAALACGAVGRRGAELAGAGEAWGCVVGVLVAWVVAATPWVGVTASLAYNDAAMVLLLACGLRAAMEVGEQGAWRAGALVGLLCGGAVSVKMSAMVVGVPAVGVVLVLMLRARRAKAPLKALAWSGVAGAVMLLPWMVRNAASSGNPVFPFAAGLFGNGRGGTGHWTGEQVERFSRSHRFEGGVGARVRAALVTDVRDPVRPVKRGFTHGQWGVYFAAVLAGAAAAMSSKPARRSGGVLVIGFVVGAGMWLLGTHIQSRFLLALVPAGAGVMGAGCGCGRWRRAAVVALVCVGAAQGAFMVWTLRGEGAASAMLTVMPVDVMRAAGGRYQTPEMAMNAIWEREPGAKVALIGSATPLYYRKPVEYATAWDAGAFDAGALRSRGVRYAVIDFVELVRLRASGYLHPGVDPEAVGAWARREARVVGEWPGRGQVLVEVAR